MVRSGSVGGWVMGGVHWGTPRPHRKSGALRTDLEGAFDEVGTEPPD